MATREVKVIYVLDDKVTAALKKMGKEAKKTSKGVTSLGRKMTFMGFVLGAAARRINRAFGRVVNVFKGLITEGADVAKATSWLGDKLEALAFAGALTGDKMEEVVGVWGEMFSNAGELRGELALLDTKVQATKNVIVEELIEALGETNTALDGVDWTTFNTNIGTATDSFLTPIVNKIKELIGEEGEDGGIAGLSSKLDDVGTIAGMFSSGFIQGIADMITWVDDLTGEDSEGGGGFGGLIYALGSLTPKLTAVSIPLILIGGAISGAGGILQGLGALLSWIGVGSPLMIALAALLTIVINLKNAFDDLKRAGETFGPEIRLPGAGDLEDKTVGGIIGGGGLGTGEDTKITSDLTGRILGHRQLGGIIPSTGLYQLHAGERVVSPGRHNTTNMGGVSLNFYGVTNAQEMARIINRELGRLNRSTLIMT